MDSAGIPWYSTGTVNVTQGSSNVAGVGTNWANAGLKVGDIFTIDKSRLYQITEVNSNTLLTLQEAYQGATGTAQVYFVIRNFAGTMQAQIAAQVSELVNKYETYIDTELKQITGPAGPTSFPYRGTWVTGRTYNGLDVVQYGNQLYMALYGHTSTSANAPGATGTAWTQLTFDAAFSATKAEIAAVANAGAKNLLPPIPASQAGLKSGINFVVNADGTVAATGTATARINIWVTHQNLSPFFYLRQGEYIFSCLPITTDSSQRNYFGYYGFDGETERYYDYGGGVKITVNSARENKKVIFGLYVEANGTVNNLIFSPMIRDAAIEDNKYIQYGMTNTEITKKITDSADWAKSDNNIMPFYYMKSMGLVFIRFYGDGLKTNITTGSSYLLDTLPAGFRPSAGLFAFLSSATITKNIRLEVRANGTINLRTNENMNAGEYIQGIFSFPT